MLFKNKAIIWGQIKTKANRTFQQAVVDIRNRFVFNHQSIRLFVACGS